MLQRHVAATKNFSTAHWGDMKQASVAGTKSQRVHTHENVAGTCARDMLQRHVPSCELIPYNCATPIWG